MARWAENLPEEIIVGDGLCKYGEGWLVMPPGDGFAALAIVEVWADRQVRPTILGLRKMLAQGARR